MSMTVEALIELRNRTLEAFIDGRISKDTSRADLAAIAIEVDRILSPKRPGDLEGRAARVVGAILADSRARQAAVAPAKAARIEFWRRRRLEGLRHGEPAADGAGARQEAEVEEAEPDEVRMARPVLAALRDERAFQGAPERLRAIADRPVPPPSPRHLPASPDVTWTEDDRLIWAEFIGGVPCQGCGRPFLGDETSQSEGESWTAYRERMAPIEAAFRARHPDHGTSWTVGGGPAHCRRCCAPHPLSPEQIRQIIQILHPATPRAPAPEVRVRRCGTCHKPLSTDHVCQLEDLPQRLRAVVKAVTRPGARAEHVGIAIGHGKRRCDDRAVPRPEPPNPDRTADRGDRCRVELLLILVGSNLCRPVLVQLRNNWRSRGDGRRPHPPALYAGDPPGRCASADTSTGHPRPQRGA